MQMLRNYGQNSVFQVLANVHNSRGFFENVLLSFPFSIFLCFFGGHLTSGIGMALCFEMLVVGIGLSVLVANVVVVVVLSGFRLSFLVCFLLGWDSSSPSFF